MVNGPIAEDGSAMLKLELVYKIVVLGSIALAGILLRADWERRNERELQIVGDQKIISEMLIDLTDRVRDLELRHTIYGWGDIRNTEQGK